MTDPINAGEAAEQALGQSIEETHPVGVIRIPVFGRPTDYRVEFCQDVLNYGCQGMSRAQIAASLGVSKTTIQNWEAAHPDFLVAMSHARDLAQAWFEHKGQFGLALPTKEFNAGLWAKQVSCRFREDYTEKKEVEHSGSGFALIVHDQPRKRD